VISTASNQAQQALLAPSASCSYLRSAPVLLRGLMHPYATRAPFGQAVMSAKQPLGKTGSVRRKLWVLSSSGVRPVMGAFLNFDNPKKGTKHEYGCRCLP